MKALTRHVLYAQQKIEGGKTVTYPLSVHANVKTAAAHKAQVAAAHKAGQVQAVMALSPRVKLTTDGKLHDNIKFAIQELPYEPTAELAGDTSDEFEL